jgi:hypothetical protein
MEIMEMTPHTAVFVPTFAGVGDLEFKLETTIAASPAQPCKTYMQTEAVKTNRQA